MIPEDELESEIMNPWRNAYWFARMLINGDKYGAVGSESKLLVEISSALRRVYEDKNISDEQKVSLSHSIIKELTTKRFENAKSRIERVGLFCFDIESKIQTKKDILVFIVTCENILIPINNAIQGIPSNDREYTVATAKAYLDQLGDDALATVVRFWDDAGVEGCLDAERSAILREFSKLRKEITFLPLTEENIVLTAFIQEFERRLGQKRKQRAGGSLEDIASFLFEYFGITSTDAPDHFQADIEVDKWVKCKDKWLIGISCKRTLRERWKQVSSATSAVLGTYKIKQIWHLITYDEDLSDDKLGLLGSNRHLFYLRDDSRQLARFQKHIGLKDYVRPMSSFIDDIKREMASP